MISHEFKCFHQRLCGICLTVDNDIILILNTYMACDTNRQDVHFIEFMEVMSEVDQLIQQLNPSHCIFGGDFNTDLERSSPQTVALEQFISDYNFIACVDIGISGVPYTYIGPNSTSKIDHFIVSPAIGDCMLSCEIIDNHLYSDHVPLNVVFDFNIDYMNINESSHECKTAWSKATDEQLLHYKNELENRLKVITLIMS